MLPFEYGAVARNPQRPHTHTHTPTHSALWAKRLPSSFAIPRRALPSSRCCSTRVAFPCLPDAPEIKHSWLINLTRSLFNLHNYESPVSGLESRVGEIRYLHKRICHSDHKWRGLMMLLTRWWDIGLDSESLFCLSLKQNVYVWRRLPFALQCNISQIHKWRELKMFLPKVMRYWFRFRVSPSMYLRSQISISGTVLISLFNPTYYQLELFF